MSQTYIHRDFFHLILDYLTIQHKLEMIIDGILLALYTSYLNSGLDSGRGRSFLKTTEEREREREKRL